MTALYVSSEKIPTASTRIFHPRSEDSQSRSTTHRAAHRRSRERSTTFIYGDVSTNSNLGSTRFLKTTDPLGRMSYVEFDNGVDPGDSSNGYAINANLIPTTMYTCNGGFLQWRNTFVWDANQYQLATANGSLSYSLAKVVHWHHSSDYTNTARTIESEKEPLENRVWYNYPGQTPGGCDNAIVFTVSSGNSVTNGASSQPSAIGRVLDNGSTHLYQYQYNAQGNVTQYIDPVGRRWSYTYAANGIDRLTTSNTTNGRADLLETRAYNIQHLPLTIKGANGKTAHYTYNAEGQPTKYTDALGEITTFSYDNAGHLKTLQGAVAAAKYTFAYDNVLLEHHKMRCKALPIFQQKLSIPLVMQSAEVLIIFPTHIQTSLPMATPSSPVDYPRDTGLVPRAQRSGVAETA